MNRIAALRVAHRAAEVRVGIAQRDFEQYADADMADPAQARTWRKLKADFDSAVHNLQWIAGQLEDARECEGLNT
jgi:hypothetical protein